MSVWGITWREHSVAGTDATYSINALQEHIPQNIKGHVTPALNTSIHEPTLCSRKAQCFLLDRKLLIPDRKCDRGQLVRRRGVREDVALLCGIVLGAGNGRIDGFACNIIDETKCGARVGDSGVAGARDIRAVNGGRGAVEHPEALRVVDRGVIDVALGHTSGGECGLVDVAESVEGLALVARVGSVAPGAQVRGEELHVLWDV